MKVYSYVFSFLTLVVHGQTIEQCKQRFDNYLNFRGSLNRMVKFDSEAIYLLNAQGKKELAIYKDEISAIADFMECSTFKQQEQFIRTKGLKRSGKRQLDSIVGAVSSKKIKKITGSPPLLGYRIAIDPGHFSTNLVDAQSEQKFLFFVPDSIKNPRDTVKIFESLLTFNTAYILKKRLEEQGAEVFITRDQADFTSFNCSFQTWIKDYRKKTLDSLKMAQAITSAKYIHLLNCSNYTLFWDFFRDYDLANRANKINTFNPHLTVIIHYNVDEKNAPWKKLTPKNYTMTFIGGGFTGDNLSKIEGKIHFLRLLLTDQLNRSENISAKTVVNFNLVLKIPIATSLDADYLKENCISTNSPGVFCRNLALCRKINSALVYGESLYQDNEKEAKLLMKSDLDLYGIKANERINQVALSYFMSVMNYSKEH